MILDEIWGALFSFFLSLILCGSYFDSKCGKIFLDGIGISEYDFEEYEHKFNSFMDYTQAWCVIIFREK